MNHEEFRASLPRMYDPLLARHGRPTPVQLQAAAPLLAGQDCLLCAPTASGKTEAWMAPIGERHLPLGQLDVPRVLVVSPTRALVNDLFRRLEPRLFLANVPIGRWTGDHHDGGRLHAVTVLTPEGLDSRLSRAGSSLNGVSAIVVDEIHVVDGTARGDQLRILLERLRARTQVQVVAASATVGDPHALAARYLRNAAVVIAGQPRKVMGRIETSADRMYVSDCIAAAAQSGFRKVLLFANSRNDVERLATFLRGRPPFGQAVFAHHGSLARSQRLSVERQFLATPTALCVATSTLEMGVDIGDVDLVALVGLPPSTASLLQRVGRGGRRGAASNVLAFLESPFEAEAMRALLAAGAAGIWHDAPYAFRPGVLVQQAISVLHERPSRTVDGAALHRRLPPDLAAVWPADRIDPVLAQAAAKGWLERVSAASGTVWGVGPKGEAGWKRATLHGNLATQSAVEVFDSLTGEQVGQIAANEGPDTPAVAGDLQLGGRGRRALHAGSGRIVTEGIADAPEARFDPNPAAPVSAAMARAILERVGIPLPCRVELPEGRVLFHGLGTAGGTVLAGCWPKKSLRAAGPLSVVFAEWPTVLPTPVDVANTVVRIHLSLARTLAMGAFHAFLPEAEQIAAVAALCEIQHVHTLLIGGMPALTSVAATFPTLTTEHAAAKTELWTQAAQWPA